MRREHGPADLAGVPQGVRPSAARTPHFPRASTTRQDLGDIEFEAYRALGKHVMTLALDRWAAYRVEAGRA